MNYDELKAASEPDVVADTLTTKADELRSAGEPHRHGSSGSERRATYRGHEIVIRTSYEVTVDGRPFDAALAVDDAGNVHYHGLPTREFASAVDLVERAIDLFPDDFPDASEPPPSGGHHDHGAHHDHDAGH